MSATAAGEMDVGKKKSTKGPGPLKRYGTLIRVTDEFADALRDASSFDKISMAEYATLHLLPIVQRRFKDAVLKRARKMEGGEP